MTILPKRPKKKLKKLNYRSRLWMKQTIRRTDQKLIKQRMRKRQKPQQPQLQSLTQL